MFLPELASPISRATWWGSFSLIGVSSGVRLLRFPERHDQNGLAALIVDLNREVILLVRGQIIPVWNNLNEDPSHSQCDLTGNFDTGQVISFGISNPALMIGNEQSVLGHDDKEYQPSTSSHQSSHRYYFSIC
ncbi:hypothetical protein JKG68_10595 [Microvirga aerilata]|uniref:Uncharacterized protein n=1 Tax=Microvirga aerilata TaxID=670292 RepID=A0A937CZU4_9HYPH|nr:hypothetical protein [Microvirga aerilata]MBL0404417.1 hypothetical protein [Microvirga aerilata]